MNICIDGFGAASLKGSGHYTYTKNLIEGLIQSYPQPDYSIIWQGEEVKNTWKRNKKLHFEDLGLDRRMNNLSKLEQYLREKQVSLFHSPNNGFSIPATKVCKNIITVHDLIVKSHPQLVDTDYKRKFDSVFAEAVKRADKIIAVSEFIKWELEKYFNLGEDKVSVIYPWYGIDVKPDISVSKAFLEQFYHLKQDFILSIGSIHARKNLSMLIRAYKASGIYREGINLVIAGSTGGKRQHYHQELNGLVESLELSEFVIFTGCVEHEDVQHFYNAARCMINISVYEGFSQVCLEAMTMGTSVICGKNSSFEEVLGNTGYYIDTTDPVQIKDAIRQISLNRNQEIRSACIRQSEKFKADESIKKIVSIYESTIY